MSINDTGPKIKLYYILLIVLVAFSSFGLGRLSQTTQNDGQVSIIYPAGDQVANTIQASPKPAPKAGDMGSNSFVASNKGSKYYPISCSAADSLKEENKVYFSTETEAQTAGYTKSSSCK